MNELKETIITKMQTDINQNNLFMKREDLLGFSFGGNKARKADLFFKALKAEESNVVVTYGTSSSNHCRVVANLALSKGIKCIIITPYQQAQETLNSKMLVLLEAEVIYCNVTDVKKIIEETLSQLKKEGYRPYFIPGGGHGNLGTQASLEMYEEIKNFEQNKQLYFDYVFVTSGTGTTQAGLVCGNILNQDNRQIIGISNARKNPYGEEVVLESVNDYLISINHSPVTIEEIHFVDDYVLDGYGSYNVGIIQTMKDVLQIEGIALDAIYTGKGFWGMKNYLEKKNITKKNILFIHTGGIPSFFDHLNEL